MELLMLGHNYFVVFLVLILLLTTGDVDSLLSMSKNL